ncbi:MAG: alpha/beta fold hydrolase [Lysobacterales bacterium]
MAATRKAKRIAAFFLIGLLVLVLIAVGQFYWQRRSVPLATFDEIKAQQGSDFNQIEVAGVQVSYQDKGSGPALVMLHGSFGSLRMFDSLARQLASDYRVIRYDQPPSGLSGPVPEGFDLSSEEFLSDLLDQLGVRNAYLLGTSSGGIIGYRFAAAYPDRVDALILSNIPPSAPVDNAGARARLPQILRWSMSVCIHQGRPWPKTCWRDFLDSNFWRKDAITDEIVTQYFDLNRRPGVMEYSSMTAIMRDDNEVKRLLAAVKAPTLLVWGMRDPVLPPATLELLAARLTAAEVKITKLEDVSHYPPLEAPMDVAVATHQFLQAVVASKD